MRPLTKFQIFLVIIVIGTGIFVLINSKRLNDIPGSPSKPFVTREMQKKIMNFIFFPALLLLAIATMEYGEKLANKIKI